MLDGSQWLSENAYGFMPVPIIITEPALGTGLGAVGLFFHESDEAREQRMEAARSAQNASAYLLPPSVTAVALGGTSNESWFTGAGHFGFWKRDRIRYEGFFSAYSVNLDFYGSGGISLPRPVSLNTEGLFLQQEIKFRLPEKSPVFLGIKQSLMDATISPNNFNGFGGRLPPQQEDQVNNLLASETTNSALGVVAQFDNRDNVFSPQQGYNYTLEYLRYDENIGGDFSYDNVQFEGLNYWPVAEQFIIGWRLHSNMVFNNPLLPPYATPYIDMRGIPVGRYLGDRTAATELEAAWKITPRWSALVFAGAGRAADSLDEFKDAETYVSKGAGFRYLMAKRYGFYMGLDVARGPEDTAWYIQAGSAW